MHGLDIMDQRRLRANILLAGIAVRNMIATPQNTFHSKLTTPVHRWTRKVGAVSAVLLGIVFLVSGAWKVFLPFQAGEVLEQAQVPAGLGVLGASALGTVELLAAFLLFVPRFRRVGGLLGSALMLFFIAWMAFYYQKLVGHECSCFPIIKRAVGPAFMVEDAVMLVMGIAAYRWSTRILTWKGPAIALLSLVIVAGASFGVNAAQRHDVQVPTPIVVNGKPQDLSHGKVFLFFYDPECSHCIAAARFMSTLNWGDTKIIGIPTHDPQFAPDFLHDTHLKAATSTETAKLRKAFTFVDPPFGVALINGEIKETFGQAQFNEPSPGSQLKALNFVR
jgi:uncharacterized membrane protein YphA (DoxX/SURF4 family)